MTSFPPRHICIAGALAITAGLGSIFGMIDSWIAGNFTINLGFVGIPIGYGLLIGRSSSRFWALFFAITGSLFLTGFGAWLAYKDFRDIDRLFYPDNAYTIVEWILVETCCLYVWIVLKRTNHKPWFESAKQDLPAARSLACSVAAVAAVLLFSYHATEWRNDQTQAMIYPFRVTVTPYNSENGNGIDSISYESDTITHDHNTKPKFPSMSVTFIGGADGMRLRFSGVATRPVELTLVSKGFQNTPVTLDRNTKDEIKVAMIPLESRKPEAGSVGL